MHNSTESKNKKANHSDSEQQPTPNNKSKHNSESLPEHNNTTKQMEKQELDKTTKIPEPQKNKNASDQPEISTHDTANNGSRSQEVTNVNEKAKNIKEDNLKSTPLPENPEIPKHKDLDISNSEISKHDKANNGSRSQEVTDENEKANNIQEDDLKSTPLPEIPEITKHKDLDISNSEEKQNRSETSKDKTDVGSNQLLEAPKTSNQKETMAPQSHEMPETPDNQKQHEFNSNLDDKNEDASDKHEVNNNSLKNETEKILAESEFDPMELEALAKEALGRDRQTGSLGNREDFGTDILFNIGPEQIPMGFRGDTFFSKKKVIFSVSLDLFLFFP